MNRIATLIAASLLTATGAFAQSLNVDINVASGTGTGVPVSTYAGAAGQTGTWNSMLTTAAGAVNLVGLNGANSGVTCTKIAGSGTSSSVSGASTDYNRLVFDYMSTAGQGSKVGVTLNGLDAGLYRLFVYASQPGAAGQWVDNFNVTNYYESLVSVAVGGSTAFGQFCGGAPVAANTFTRGDDYVVGTLVVGNGAPAVTIESYTGYTNNERAALNGFQLIKYTGNTLYVNIAATGNNTGQNWTNAFTDLHEAMKFARSSQGHITQIWVAKGTYRPTNSAAGAARSTTFGLIQGCKVLGGFDGNESLASQRDPAANLTILSGNTGNIFSNTDNSYHVVSATDVDATAVLDGFTVAGGNANRPAPPVDRWAGGLLVMDAGPTIRNVNFSNNEASDYGGAVMITGNNAPTFEHCTFTSNTAGWMGGAIFYSGPTGFIVPVLKVNNCSFLRNTATSSAGSGIQIDAGNAWIANSLFNGNSAAEGGAVSSYNQLATGSAALYNCTITNNHGFVQSGGIYTGYTSSISLRNSIVWNNTSGNASFGKEFEQFRAQPGSTISFTYCDVESENRGGIGGTGNLNVNPHFVAMTGANGIPGDADDDLRLTADSFLIDRASNNNLPTDFTDADSDGDTGERTPFDLDGNARKIDDPNTADHGVGPAPIVDFGCYEFSAPPVVPCPADFNQDGGVDQADVDAFFTAWEAGQNEADVNLDGGVDQADVDAFFSAWEAGGC